MTQFMQAWKRARCPWDECRCQNRLCANRLEADTTAALVERLKAHEGTIRVYEVAR